MWECKHCLEEFDFERTTDKANHSRHCNQNPKKQESYSKLKTILSDRHDADFGEMFEFEVECFSCVAHFTVTERSKLFPQKAKYFCSRSCANSIGGKANALNLEREGKLHYTTICFRTHDRKCLVCEFDKIVAVHHVDEDHSNNDPTNLVPLCPNHHMMVHHNRYKAEIKAKIENYRRGMGMGYPGNPCKIWA